MASLTAIRTGLATNLSALADIQVSAWMLANPTPPTIHVFPASATYDLAMQRGLDRWTLTVQAFVAAVSDIGAQKLLDALLASSGARSVKAALESDQTLGGAASAVRVTGSSGYKIFAVDGRPPVLGAEWQVEVLATGT